MENIFTHEEGGLIIGYNGIIANGLRSIIGHIVDKERTVYELTL